MRGLFHFILSHSIFVSFCAAALSLQTLLVLAVPVNAWLLAFIFFAALSGYNAYWIISRFSFSNYASPVAFLQKIKTSLVIILVAAIGMMLCIAHLRLVFYNLVITFMLLGLYTIPLLPVKQLHFTRKAGFAKTILLALAWTMVTTLVPLQVPITGMTPAALLFFINRFLFMLTLCIIFDKRDAAMDKIRGLHSMATDIGPVLLNYLVAFLILGYSITAFRLNHYSISLAQIGALFVVGILTFLAYIISLRKRGYLFYYFVVDGLMFLSGVLSLVASII